jgi:glycosyltransferase involved in cell wall biosynthesis
MSARGGRIIIDALAARYGGAAYSTVHLVQALRDDPRTEEEVILVTQRGSLLAAAAQNADGLPVIAVRSPPRFELAWRLAWEAIALPRLVRRNPMSTIITLSGMLPWGTPAAIVCYLRNPVALMAHNPANRLRRWAVRRTSRHARLIAPSAAMASLIEEVVGRRAEVVPLGVDHVRFRPAEVVGDEVLCVANLYQHKRHDVVLAAWATLPEPRPVLRFVADPRVDPRRAAEFEQMVREYGHLGEIRVQSRLSLDELVGAYHRARVFMIPSEVEGFCLPLLEALACGVPAVARDIPALRETGGDGTTYVHDDSTQAWGEALARLLADDEAHTSARAAGLEHARSFSWQRTARELRARLAN